MNKKKTMNATKFKEQCLAILDELSPEGLIITKHGRKIAVLKPYQHDSADLIGCLKDTLKIKGDIFSTGEKWDAES